MTADTIVMICVAGVLLIFLIAVVVLSVVRRRRSFVFHVRGHEVLLTCNEACSLFVDGKLEDRIAANNLRMATLRAKVEGEEFKVFVTYRAFKAEVEAFYLGLPVEGQLKV